MPNDAMTTSQRLQLPDALHCEPLAEECWLVSGRLEAPVREARWDGIAIPGLRRRLALSLHSLFVCSPTWSEQLTDIPDQCQFLLDRKSVV